MWILEYENWRGVFEYDREAGIHSLQFQENYITFSLL